jgi:hypothetical protein
MLCRGTIERGRVRLVVAAVDSLLSGFLSSADPMRRPLLTVLSFAVACAVSGCKAPPEARYVMRSDDVGVVAMPRDTPENRARAYALMQSHFPEGFEIVREVEGSTVVALQQPGHRTHLGHRSAMYDPVAAAAWREPGFQREIESLPGTPQSMEGYARQPAPSVGLHFGDVPAPPAGMLVDEWRIVYRRKRPIDSEGEPLPESLFPDVVPSELQPAAASE